MIAHVDADAFFASVLQRKNPQLRGKPLLALGMGPSDPAGGRAGGGCVIAASYEAKAKGVKTGMPYRDAIKLCPDALSVPSDFRETGLASKQIESILGDQCPILEQMSIDEWFLDLSTVPGGIPKDLRTWATDLQRTIVHSTGLSVSIGVAPTKLLAKMASEYRKPAGITLVTHTSHSVRGGRAAPHDPAFALGIEAFLRDRPAPAIPGIGRRRVIHTDARGWKTAWDIAAADREEMDELFGKNGRDMQRELLGVPMSQVSGEAAPPQSVSRCRSFKKTLDPDFLWAHLLRHLEYTVLKMRRHGLMCRGISVWLRRGYDQNYQHDGTNASLPQPADTTEAILPVLRHCFEEVYEKGTAYTQAGLALWHLVPTAQKQSSLFEDATKATRDDAIQASLDRLHQRFGRSSITRGAALQVETGTTPGLSVYD